MSEIIDFDAPADQGDAGAQADVRGAVSKIASLNARAVMPDGRLLDRSQILATLGLNPGTSPTAWLNIAGCGSNASALLPGDLQRIAVGRVGMAASVLRQVHDVAGVASGGAAPAASYATGGAAPTK